MALGSTGCGLALVGLVLVATTARAEGSRPAVATPNATVSFGYAGGFFPDDGRSWEHSYGPAGALTLPLGHHLGVALIVGGSWSDLSDSAIEIDSNRVSIGAPIFYRDPDRGFAGIGYRWTRTSRSTTLLIPTVPVVATFHQDFDSHDLAVFGGLYLGELDLSFGAEYTRTSGEVGFRLVELGSSTIVVPTGFPDGVTIDSYQLGAGLAGYPGAADAFLIGFDLVWQQSFTRDRPNPIIPDRRPKRLTTELSVQWQLPTGRRRFARIGVFGVAGVDIVGRLIEPNGLPIPTEYYGVYGVGAWLSFDWPTADSLKELFRAYRLR